MQVSHLTKNYQTSTVLDIEHLHMEPGFAHGLLGANGAGKSTLIKIMLGLVHANSGEVDASDDVSLLPENPYLPENLTAFQIVSHACRMQRETDSAEELLAEVGLKREAWHKAVRTYSKGMKQRTSIAYAMAGKPEWLILDEPMSGLDAMGRKHMLNVFSKRITEGMSVLMCSHAVTDLVRLCDKVHIMAKGNFCETFEIHEHSMSEVEALEKRLVHWSSDDASD